MDQNLIQQRSAEAADQLDADIVLLNSPIDHDLGSKFRELMSQRASFRSNVVIILVTEGGLADVAYRIGRKFQDRYESVTICVAGWCKSAGTLLAIGGHTLVVGDNGELGPLDVQIAVRDEVDDRNSGLVLESAIDSLQNASFKLFENFMMEIKQRSANRVTFRTAADLAAQMSIGMMSPIFAQIDPIRMGDDARSQQIGQDYAWRLNLRAKNLASLEALNMLLRGYPSHSFVIDRGEAESLFTNVKPISGILAELIDSLGDFAEAPVPDGQGVLVFLNGEDDVETAANDENGCDASTDDGTTLAQVHEIAPGKRRSADDLQ